MLKFALATLAVAVLVFCYLTIGQLLIEHWELAHAYRSN